MPLNQRIPRRRLRDAIKPFGMAAMVMRAGWQLERLARVAALEAPANKARLDNRAIG